MLFSTRRSLVTCYTVAVIALMHVSCGNHHIVKDVVKLDYPSASAIEFVKGQFWVIGDDANDLIVLDSQFQRLDSIQLYNHSSKRIPKAVKPDLEAAATIRREKKPGLLVLGSGSLSPYRNIALLIDPVTKAVDSIRLDTLYQRIQSNGIRELNIESAAVVPGNFVLTNRGSKGYPYNFMIFLSPKFWMDQARSPVNIVRIGGNEDSLQFKGVSGMAYSAKSDRLILTISTEDTRNALEDGAIGTSYLWIIDNITGKKRWKAINPNKIINLDNLDDRFKGQKIESVCITKESSGFIHLVLVADNDDGSSTIFKMIVEK